MINKFLHQNTLILLVLGALRPKNTLAKIVLKLLSVPVRTIVFLTFVFAWFLSLSAQDGTKTDTIFTDNPSTFSDSAHFSELETVAFNDTLLYTDTLQTDSLQADSLAQPKQSKSAFSSEVQYSAEDSIRVSLIEEKLFLFGKAHVKYENIELDAQYIEINYASEEVFARGMPDTSGIIIGSPVFKQDNESFESDSLKYNFNSENGIIYHIVTEQGDGYLHSGKTKRHAEGHIHLRDGKYTTCDADHPHFYLALKKGIVIPEDKIITGHAYMVIADVPLKVIGIPFGFFPNTTQRASGLLMPTYGSEERRGFYLKNFGWYQVLGDYADWRIMGDYYTKGSWAMRNTVSYKLNYKFTGRFGFNLAVNKVEDDLDYVPSKDYSVLWSHSQDAKSNPTQSFSASVNFSSSSYEKNHSYNTNEYLTNNKASSISYSKRWPGSPFNLSLSANANQNSQTKITDMSLPTGSFNMSSVYPFRKKEGNSKYKWYENISLNYSSSFRNNIKAPDSLLGKAQTWDWKNMENGFQHSIPFALNFKLGKIVTITPSLSYKGTLYTKKILRQAYYDEANDDVFEVADTVHGLSYLHAVNPSLSMGINPKVYGMYVSSKEDGYIEAVRHVLSPSAGFSFVPDMRTIMPNYYDSMMYDYNGVDTLQRVYSPWEDEIYGIPSANGKSGSIRLGLNNNLEMKVRPKNDTTGESKKVVILDNLNFSTSYNPFADAYKWSDVSMVTGSRLFNSKLDIRLNARFSPYALGYKGTKVDTFYFQTNRRLLRFTNMTVSSGFSLKSKSGKSDEEAEDRDDLEDDFTNIDNMQGEMDFVAQNNAAGYVDFDVPWTLRFDYSYSINKNSSKPSTQQTLRVRGDFSLTPKWKIGGSSGYDFEAKEVTFTTLNIYRDLHCWEMRFTIVPFGPRASYSFTIQAKGSLLRDLKYEKEPNWYDKF